MSCLLESSAVPLGRLLLSAIFIMSGLNKITSWQETAEMMASEGMIYVHLLLFGAIFLEVVGGLSLLLGCWAGLGSLMLMVFLVPTTLIFHDFWAYEGQAQQMQMAHFMKNMAILGGLLIVLGLGPGKLCVTGTRKLPPKTEDK